MTENLHADAIYCDFYICKIDNGQKKIVTFSILVLETKTVHTCFLSGPTIYVLEKKSEKQFLAYLMKKYK